MMGAVCMALWYPLFNVRHWVWRVIHLYPQNDWTGWQNGVNYHICAQIPTHKRKRRSNGSTFFPACVVIDYHFIKGKLHSKIIRSDLIDFFSVESEGEGPSSKLGRRKNGTCELLWLSGATSRSCKVAQAIQNPILAQMFMASRNHFVRDVPSKTYYAPANSRPLRSLASNPGPHRHRIYDRREASLGKPPFCLEK